jgi:REP element-mobilizing transposase RayT
LGPNLEVDGFMPRGPRIDFPGAVHHVYARGIEKRNIFLSDADRMFFLEKVGSNLERWNMRCAAWALMPNHFHLLLRSDAGLLPSFMRCLLTGYSKYFNEKHNRVGHFFQNRYKSPIIVKEGYFREVLRYIHLNPLRSGIVRSIDELDEYSWTGHRKIVRSGYPEWQDTRLLREVFGGSGNKDGWFLAYREYMTMYLETDPATEGGRLPAEEQESAPDNLGDTGNSHEVFSGIVNRISARRGVPVEEVLGGNRRYDVVDVRREILKTCRDRMGISLTRLAHWLGIKENTASHLLKTNPRVSR